VPELYPAVLLYAARSLVRVTALVFSPNREEEAPPLDNAPAAQGNTRGTGDRSYALQFVSDLRYVDRLGLEGRHGSALGTAPGGAMDDGAADGVPVDA
jgi:hypothetical protein